MSIDRIDERLGRLGERLAGLPSVVERVMGEVDRAEPVLDFVSKQGSGTYDGLPRPSNPTCFDTPDGLGRPPYKVLRQSLEFKRWRILTIMFQPRNFVAATAVLTLVIFGVRPWAANRESGPDAWWLAPPSAWAGELQATIDEAGHRGFSCREQFVHVTSGGSQSTSSTTSTLFAAGNRYRRDIYDQGRLRESQWYVQDAAGLTMTSVRYNDKTYTVTRDPQARQKDVDPRGQIEALAQLLDEHGRRLGTARVEGQDAVEFEIAAKKIDAMADESTMHVWLDQATKMPLKITYQFVAHGGLGQTVATTLVQDHFDWNPTLPADTFEPEIRAGFSKVESK